MLRPRRAFRLALALTSDAGVLSGRRYGGDFGVLGDVSSLSRPTLIFAGIYLLCHTDSDSTSTTIAILIVMSQYSMFKMRYHA